MSHIRALRLSQGLTLIDLALLTDIPARTLAEIEYGLQRLDFESRARLAHFFGIQPDLLRAGREHAQAMPRAVLPATPTTPDWLLQRAAPALVVALVGAGLLGAPHASIQASAPLVKPGAVAGLPPARALATSRPRAPRRAAITAPNPTATTQPTATAQRPTATLEPATAAPATATIEPAAAAAVLPTPMQKLPTATPESSGFASESAPALPASPPALAASAATARFTLAPDGPRGCPIAPAAGRVVMTQGYGEGSHAPANVWGAIDLGVDGDGDGYAEPGATWGATVLAALSGRAQVFMNSWPGGNFVRVVDDQSGWSVAYGHLDTVTVADGQRVAAGAAIGTVGSTGMATGPHLHYEVWHNGENIDPTGLAGC